MLKIKLRRSGQMAAVLTVAHGAGIVFFAMVGLPLWARIAGAGILIVQWVFCMRRHALMLAADSPTGIEINSNNEFSLGMRSCEWRNYDVLGSTYVMPYLTVLQLQQKGGRAINRIALLPDSLQAEDFRKLRVWLRWKEGDQAS